MNMKEETFSVRDIALNLEALIEQIRGRIEKKKTLGFYSDAEIEKIRNLAIQLTADIIPIKDKFLYHLKILSECSDITKDHTITSHRPFLGKFIVLGKRLVIPPTQFVAGVFFNKQVKFNRQVTAFINFLCEEMEKLLTENQALKNRCQALENHCKILEQRLNNSQESNSQI